MAREGKFCPRRHEIFDIKYILPRLKTLSLTLPIPRTQDTRFSFLEPMRRKELLLFMSFGF
jgi:hypothetical protein